MKKLSLFLLAAFSNVSAWAASVAVTGDLFDLSKIKNFYDGIGHAAVIGSTPSALDLDGVSLLWVVQPAHTLSSDDLTAMEHFLGTGGRITFMGEHGFYRPNENLRINSAIASLGGHITIENLAPDAEFHVASKANGQILTAPLTEGVDQFEYACFAPLLLSAGAQALMRGQDDPTDIMMAYEAIGAGSIVVVADENGWDNEPTGWPSGADNGRLFANLIPGPLAGGGGAVPEPSTYGLLGAVSLLGLSLFRRRHAVLRS